MNLPLPPASPPAPPQTVPPVLRFDWRDWLPFFESEDVPEDQKRVLIETLWSIIIAFVDLGWQVQPAAGVEGDGIAAETTNAQAHGMTAQSCGQSFDLKAALEAAVLRSDLASGAKEVT